jgi:hypothetical protein
MPYFYEQASGWKAASKLNTWPVSPGTSVESFFADWAAVAREEESVLQAIFGGTDLMNADSQFVDSHNV